MLGTSLNNRVRFIFLVSYKREKRETLFVGQSCIWRSNPRQQPLYPVLPRRFLLRSRGNRGKSYGPVTMVSILRSRDSRPSAPSHGVPPLLSRFFVELPEVRGESVLSRRSAGLRISAFLFVMGLGTLMLAVPVAFLLSLFSVSQRLPSSFCAELRAYGRPRKETFAGFPRHHERSQFAESHERVRKPRLYPGSRSVKKKKSLLF